MTSKPIEKLNLVTGACGFSGSQLVKQLLESGERVIATDLPKAFEHPKNVFTFKRLGIDFAHPYCKVIPSNLLDKRSLAALFKEPITHVFHTASLYDYTADMATLRRVNIDGSLNLFELAAEHAPLERFVHWSTCGIFGKPYTARDGVNCNVPFTETSSSPKNTPFGQAQPNGTHLVNDYSVTKWEQEQQAWRFHRERGLPLTVIRPAPIYGPGSDYGHGGIVISINKGHLPLIPIDSRNYITTSIHVEDLARFAQFAAVYPGALGEDYNVVDDSIISYYEFTRYLALLVGRKMMDLPIVNLRRAQPVMAAAARLATYLEKKVGLPRPRMLEVGSASYVSSSYWLGNGKSKATGFVYKHPDVKAGMRDTVQWFRDAGWLEPGYSNDAIWAETLLDPSRPWKTPKRSWRAKLRRPLAGSSR